MANPPRRGVLPGTGDVDGPPVGYQDVPLDVIRPFRAFWDAFGTGLPHAVTRQKRKRRALLRLIR